MTGNGAKKTSKRVKIEANLDRKNDAKSVLSAHMNALDLQHPFNTPYTQQHNDTEL